MEPDLELEQNERAEWGTAYNSEGQILFQITKKREFATEKPTDDVLSVRDGDPVYVERGGVTYRTVVLRDLLALGHYALWYPFCCSSCRLEGVVKTWDYIYQLNDGKYEAACLRCNKEFSLYVS